MNKLKTPKFVILLIIPSIMLFVESCETEDEFEINQMLSKLSDYKIYTGNQADLIPYNEYKLYELSSTLFTDYAEKQRLIKVPPGTAIKAINDGLVDFPEGTILVKTFYYYLDRRDTLKGKNIIETRLLVKNGSEWKLGVYKWNKDRTDAALITSGQNQIVNWIDIDGKPNVISYHVPSNAECRTCHSSNGNVMPIGPKVRNMNFEVVRSNSTINQLVHLQNIGTMLPADTTSFSTVPDYNNGLLTLEQRARAYLDINCAHCHSDGGFANNRNPRFGYENSLQSSKILEEKSNIIQMIEAGEMPKLGTTILDKENVELIKNYLNSL